MTSLLARIEQVRAAAIADEAIVAGMRESVSVRAAYAFGYWPARDRCGELDTYRNEPCRRLPGHDGYHSAVGCSLGC